MSKFEDQAAKKVLSNFHKVHINQDDYESFSDTVENIGSVIKYEIDKSDKDNMIICH